MGLFMNERRLYMTDLWLVLNPLRPVKTIETVIGAYPLVHI
jgi:hypothetical protein